MMHVLKSRKAQQTAEYAILIAFVIAAAMAIQTYVKRGLQAKVRDAVIGYTEQTAELGDTDQYEPYYLSSNFVTTSDMQKTEEERETLEWQREIDHDNTQRTGSQTYGVPTNGG